MNRRINPQKPPRVSVLAAKAIMVQSAKVLPLALVIGLLVGLVGARVAAQEVTEREVVMDTGPQDKYTYVFAGKGTTNVPMKMKPGLYQVTWFAESTNTIARMYMLPETDTPNLRANDKSHLRWRDMYDTLDAGNSDAGNSWSTSGHASTINKDAVANLGHRMCIRNARNALTGGEMNVGVLMLGFSASNCHRSVGEQLRLYVDVTDDTEDYWVLAFHRVAPLKAITP